MFNKLKRNLIKLVHPDKISSIKGDGVDEEIVKKDFEEASVAINEAIDYEVAWLRVDGRGNLPMPNSDALDNAVRKCPGDVCETLFQCAAIYEGATNAGIQRPPGSAGRYGEPQSQSARRE